MSQKICDFCGRRLESYELHIIPPAPVVKATSSGYVPSKRPATWSSYSQKEWALGWQHIVKVNSNVDWGICTNCKEEVNHFNDKTKNINKTTPSHVLLIWSHPEEHSQNQMLSIISSIIPNFSELTRNSEINGKIGTIWIDTPISSYDILGAAKESFGLEILDEDKYKLRTYHFSQGKGEGKCLVFYKSFTKKWWQFWKTN